MLPSWLSSCKDFEPTPEIQYAGIVAIIGAGAAGLYAADILNAKGITVKVFEASDRVGGRIKNLRQNDRAIRLDGVAGVNMNSILDRSEIRPEVLC